MPGDSAGDTSSRRHEHIIAPLSPRDRGIPRYYSRKARKDKPRSAPAWWNRVLAPFTRQPYAGAASRYRRWLSAVAAVNLRGMGEKRPFVRRAESHQK
jgi:hypothetical protein